MTSLSFCILGLFLAGLMAELADYPQPALLYLVPCVLLPMTVKALVQVYIVSLCYCYINMITDF